MHSLASVCINVLVCISVHGDGQLAGWFPSGFRVQSRSLLLVLCENACTRVCVYARPRARLSCNLRELLVGCNAAFELESSLGLLIFAQYEDASMNGHRDSRAER